jgi:hypothetical protein
MAARQPRQGSRLLARRASIRPSSSWRLAKQIGIPRSGPVFHHGEVDFRRLSNLGIQLPPAQRRRAQRGRRGRVGGAVRRAARSDGRLTTRGARSAPPRVPVAPPVGDRTRGGGRLPRRSR